MGQAASRTTVPRQTAAKIVSRTFPEASPSLKAPPPPPPPKVNDVPSRPAPPEGKPIIEPGLDPNDWNRADPKYGDLVQQVVGRITSHPVSTEGKLENAYQHVRSMPADRHTNVASGLTDEVKARTGKINLRQLRELLIKQKLGSEKDDLGTLAKTYSVDVEVLRKVVGQLSNPIQGKSQGLNVH